MSSIPNSPMVVPGGGGGSSGSLFSSRSLLSCDELEASLNEINVLSDGSECVIFCQKDLPNVSLPVMEDIRRMGKLCDVTIKVRSRLVVIPS